MSKATTAAIVGAIAIVGCSDRPSPELTTVSDSAGVTITVSRGPSIDPGGWTISDAPITTISTVGADYALHYVSGVTSLRDGRVVLANTRSNRVLVFDPDGSLLRAIGGQGEGPGEFSTLETVVVSEFDTLIAHDLRRQQATYFDTLGQVARTLAFDHGPQIRYPLLTGILEDGRLTGRVARQAVRPNSEVGLVSLPYEVIVIGSDGKTQPSLRVGLTDYLVYEDGERLRALSPPLRSTVYDAVSADRILVASSSALVVSEWSPDGSLLRRSKIEQDLSSLSASEWSALVDDRLEEANPDRRPALSRAYAALQRPEAWPAVNGLRTDAQGYVWVAHHPGASPTSRQTWSVLDPSGAWVTDVSMPVDLEVQHIGRDRISGIRRSELGEESVEVFRLTRTGTEPSAS